MTNPTPIPPPPPGWNKTSADLLRELSQGGKIAILQEPEMTWARMYEHSLLPKDLMPPKAGEVYEARHDVELSYLISYAAPFTGGERGWLKKGERIRISRTPPEFAVAAHAKPLNAREVKRRMVPFWERWHLFFTGFNLVVRFTELQEGFDRVPS